MLAWRALYLSQVRRRKQPLRQDALAQLGSSRAQQLVQTVRAEQVQVIPIDMMRDGEARAARAFAAPLIVEPIKTCLIKIRRAPRLAALITDALVINQQGYECQSGDEQPQCGSAVRPKAQPCHDQKCNADGQTQPFDARIEGVEARDARAAIGETR